MPSTARTRGRLTGTLRPPRVTDPASVPCRLAVRSGSCFPFGPHTALTSACINWAITCNPAPTARASSPSRMSAAISSIATLTCSGTDSMLVSASFIWYLLFTVVPCLLGSSLADAQHLPQGRHQAGDRHLKFHESRDNLKRSSSSCSPAWWSRPRSYEHPNGLLRQSLPQGGTDLSRWSADDLEAVAHALGDEHTRASIQRLDVFELDCLSWPPWFL